MKNILILIMSLFVFGATAQDSDNMTRTGVIKTSSDKVLGGAFVAMNKNVVFTAAHILTFEEELIFENNEGKSFPLRIVATDQQGDIAVFITSNDITQSPFAINLNYTMDETTIINVVPTLTNGQKSNKMNLAAALVKKKSVSLHKNMEYKSLDLTTKSQPAVGSPLLNANNEVIGVITTSSNKKSTVSVLDGDLWDKM